MASRGNPRHESWLPCVRPLSLLAEVNRNAEGRQNHLLGVVTYSRRTTDLMCASVGAGESVPCAMLRHGKDTITSCSSWSNVEGTF
jgi:hypothetical protein